MSRLDGKWKRPAADLAYSLAAYAVPTFVLQFVILPLIARRLSADDNGLFLALFNGVRLCVSLFVVPLADIRLLKKKECAAEPLREKGFNCLFLTVTAASALIVTVLQMAYGDWTVDWFALLRLIAVLLLISAHDYFAISFRLDLSYRSILADNLIIVLGYAFGILLMLKLGWWELVFICGYACGLTYTLVRTRLWRRGVRPNLEKATLTQYGLLSVSSGLNNATTFCDKMLIYPIIGGLNVSVYNAASVVSKMMLLISSPLRNVLLSYIVDAETVAVSVKKRRRLIGIVLGVSLLLYGVFYGASVVFCRLLYPQFFQDALRYIPVILLAVLLETYASLLKVYLLRFENTALQAVTSAVKVALYLVSVLVMTGICRMALMGFCLSILIADLVHFLIVLLYFVKNLKK